MPKTKPVTMTKAKILAHLAEVNELSKKQVAAFLSSYAELAYKETKKNKKFTLPGIGILKISKRKARTGRNPATGETIKISARSVVKMTISKACKDAVVGTK